MRTLKIYGTGSATANAVASVIVPTKSRIRGVQWNLLWDGIADNASVIAEISRSSAREIQTNGAQQCISEAGGYVNLLTSGIVNGMSNFFTPADIPVDQGQIIYLHATITGTITFYATAILHYEG